MTVVFLPIATATYTCSRFTAPPSERDEAGPGPRQRRPPIVGAERRRRRLDVSYRGSEDNDVKKLLLLALLAAIAALVVKALQFMKEWEDLPESELRARIEEKLSSRVSPEQLTEITNAVVDMMRQRGKLGGEAPAGA
jgi:hypothetical protein